MMRLIAAVARDGGLGKDGKLLFHIPEDLHRFKRLTLGGTLIMGRSTLDSLPGGKALPGRRNLVLTRERQFSREGVEAFHSVGDLLAALTEGEEAWVIGGGEVYGQFLPLCSQLFLTQVNAAPPADRFFPALGEEWTLSERSPWQEEKGLRYRFCRYTRNEENVIKSVQTDGKGEAPCT
jgi:dihydrofolate reductase